MQIREDLEPLLQGDVIPTKSQLLQMVMSIFELLGLISLVVVHEKKKTFGEQKLSGTKKCQ